MAWKYKSNSNVTKQALLKAVGKATRDTAKAIAKGAKGASPVDTGALKASVYWSDSMPNSIGGDRSGYSAATAAAISANSEVTAHIEPEIRAPATTPGVLKCAVASAVEYAEAVEKGGYTGNGYRAAKPFLSPSATEQEPQFEARVNGALRTVEARQKL